MWDSESTDHTVRIAQANRGPNLLREPNPHHFYRSVAIQPAFSCRRRTKLRHFRGRAFAVQMSIPTVYVQDLPRCVAAFG